MQKWEYLSRSNWLDERELNALGEQGWELVAVASGGRTSKETGDIIPGFDSYRVRLYFKRPKSDEDENRF